MEDEAVAPAPEQDITADPVSVETPPETPKTFTQEELDSIIAKRLAREQRKWEREQKASAVVTRPVEPPPVVETADDAKAYAEALAEQKAHEILERQRQSEALETYYEREEDARAKYDDFEQVAYNPNLTVTEVMAQTIQLSEVGPDLIYHLGSNPKEAERIARLPPFLQAKEIGKLEAKLAASPPVKKTSTAPAPIAPVTARSTSSAAYDTTDPRSIKSMSTSEWIEAERQRQIRRYEAQRNR
jgi:hypothetical protein